MKKLISILGGFILTFAFATSVYAVENWDVKGTYTLALTCTSGCGGTWNHTMNITVEDLDTGVFSGTGFFITNPAYAWNVTGTVSGDNISFYIDYTGLNPTYYVNAIGTIAANGTMSGTATAPGQTFTWTTTSGAAKFNRRAEITSPDSGEIVYGNVSFEAYLMDNDYDYVDWAVRKGTCAAGTNTVFGNVDGYSNPYSWAATDPYKYEFLATADTSSWIPGMYCFIFNPREDGGESEIRLTRQFSLKDTIAPIVTIEAPSEGELVDGSVVIYGTIVEDYELSHYNISIYPGNADFNDFSLRLEQKTEYVSSGFNNQPIYTWDTTAYADGEYLIRLAARDKAGNRDLSGDAWVGGDDSQHVIRVTVDNITTKAEVLIRSGVPGKGLENAPGLQKPFNPNSKAAENAGKKK